MTATRTSAWPRPSWPGSSTSNGTRLEADGTDVATFLRELAEEVKVYGDAVEAEDKAMDAYLLARANQAEAYAQLTEYEFKILQYFENMSEADWAVVPPEVQRNYERPWTTSARSCPSIWLPCPSRNAVSWRGLTDRLVISIAFRNGAC